MTRRTRSILRVAFLATIAAAGVSAITLSVDGIIQYGWPYVIGLLMVPVIVVISNGVERELRAIRNGVKRALERDPRD